MTKQATRQKLLKVQRKIFNSLRAEADRLLGDTPLPIRKYEKAFQRDFSGIKGKLQAVGKPELIRAIRGSDVSIVADFHTFAQAQRTALRLMRDCVPSLSPRVSPERWFVGLEFVSSQFQPELDQFQAGKMSLNEFLAMIHYHDEWGFPWRNYSPIFDWARENGVRLIALNRPRETLWKNPPALRRGTDPAGDFSDLLQRDQWAAGVITDLFGREIEQGRKPRMIALYGELHCYTGHIPLQIKRVSKKHLGRSLKTLSVHQNHDELYWELARRGRETKTQAIRLKKDAFCVISSTPWTKLQSLVSWVEGEIAEDVWEDGTDERSDYLALMRTYSQALAEFLGIAAPNFDSVTVHTIDDADFLESFPSEIIRFHVLNNLRLYIPDEEIAYLGIPSHNSAAELASIHLFREKTGMRRQMMANLDDFHRTVLESAFGFFGSLILNPHRKCDYLTDHEQRLRQLKYGSEPAFPLERESRELAIGLLRDTADLSPLFGRKHYAPVLMTAARFAGQIYGKQIHAKMLDGKISLDKIRHLFLARARIGAFEKRFRQLLDLVGQTPQDATKAHRL